MLEAVAMIQIHPFPAGKRFAFSFVDDTDRSTRANTEPVYAFLKSRGFMGTKTVWVRRATRNSAYRVDLERATDDPSTGATLDDSEYRDFVLSLRDQGFEIAMHGIAAGNSRREEIVEGLETFRKILGTNPKMNVFHQANIENLYCGAHKLDSPLFRTLERFVDDSNYEGQFEGSPYFWGDLARATFKYVRLPFHTIAEPDTLRVNPDMPFHDPRRPFVNYWFANSDGADCGRFVRLVSPGNVAKVRENGGVCFIYTHFAKGFARLNNGVWALDPAFVQAVDWICSHDDVWTPPGSELLDRMLAIRRVSVELRDFTLTIANEGTDSLRNLALSVGGESVVVPELAPASRVVLRIRAAGRASIAARLRDSIPPRRRRRIEYYNYLGLIVGKIADRRDRR